MFVRWLVSLSLCGESHQFAANNLLLSNGRSSILGYSSLGKATEWSHDALRITVAIAVLAAMSAMSSEACRAVLITS